MQGKTRRSLIHTMDAQASVLGFVIILGILLATTSLYLGFNVPKWTAEFEFAHEAKVEHDFSDLSATIDLALISEDPTASSSIAIGMAPERVQLVGIFASGGTLQFDPQNEAFACVAALPNETVVNEGEVIWWNSTAASNNFSVYDKYHVETPEEGAKLQLSAGGDGNYSSGGEGYLNGEFWFINFTVTNNTTLYTHWLTVHAKNIVIGPNSSINADGGGMAGGKCVGYPNLSESGQGEGGGEIPSCRHPKPPSSSRKYCYCGAGGGGAGHYSEGGKGGSSWTREDRWCSYSYCSIPINHSGGAGGSTYGNATNITTADAGSGGATAGFGQRTRIQTPEGTADCCFEGGFGGDGGGVIHLDAPTITIRGNVSVNGEDGHYSKDLDRAWDSAGGGGGGGSGGTILLKGTTINIFGNLSAKGGKGADGALACHHRSDVYDSNGGGGGGGSGGVIKIFYATLSTPSDLNYHTNVSGGAGGNGGVGKSDGCSSSTTPKAGGNGSRGGDGLIYPKPYPEYAESVPHHPSGYLISNVTALHGSIGYPASNTSMIRYDNMTWGEYTPSGTSIALKVRTSMYASMIGALSWEECPEVTMGQTIADLPSVSNGHRYIQWRADLVTLDRSRTPKLMWVNISYGYERPILMNATGNIAFCSQYLYHPDYKLIYEHGAIIKEPSQGNEFMLLPPPLIIARDANNCTSLIISALNLIGNASSSSGAFSSSIAAYYQSSALRKGGLTSGLGYDNLTLNLTTKHSTAWKNWFNVTCKDAGLMYGSMTTAGGYYFDEPGNNTLSVIFTGNESKPVYLWLKYAEARIEIPKLPKRA